MLVDKSWMQFRRSSESYFEGVESFLNYVYKHVKSNDSKNRYRHMRSEVHKHLFYNRIKLTYTTWYFHSEDEDNDRDETDETDSDNERNYVTNMKQDVDMHSLIEEGCS